MTLDVRRLTKEEEDKILLEATRRFVKTSFFETYEELFTSPDGFGITKATPLQRAVCRILEGLPLGDLAPHQDVIAALGGNLGNFKEDSYKHSSKVPAEVVLISGVRTGKSMLAALIAIMATQRCNLDMLSSGEIPRYSILSLELDNARVVMGHLVGVLEKPRLAALRVPDKEKNRWSSLIDETGADVIGSEFLYHPSGRPVEIRVVAGKRAGGSLVSRWSIGSTFDEAPRMLGGSEGVVNYDDAKRAVRTRLLPGAQILSIGSPWQPYGPIYDIVQAEWGNPIGERIVIKAPGPLMNPFWWTPERCEEIKKSDPIAYQTDVLAEFADAEESLFTQALINGCLRDNIPIPYIAGHDYVAATDPATRGNAWTLVVADRKGRKKRIVFAQQWIGTTVTPLSPKQVLSEIKYILATYHLDWCYTDQWAADANKDLAVDLGFSLVIEDWNQEEKVNAYLSLATAMAEKSIEFPNDPNLTKDLKLTKRKATQRGVTIHLPVTPDGRHCDYAPAVVHALKHWIEEDHTPTPQKGENGYWQHFEENMIKEEEEEFQNKSLWWNEKPYLGVLT